MNACVVALGKFNALHKGHAALIKTAAEMGHPAILQLQGMAAVMGWQERLPLFSSQDWLEKLQAIVPEKDIQVYRLEFSKVRNLSPIDFLDDFCQRFAIAGFCCGPDFRFGFKRAGDVAVLQDYCKAHNLKLRVLDFIEDNEEKISSSRIRMALEKGDVAIAAQMLGHYHAVQGQVVAGEQHGRTINFPTANIHDWQVQVPAPGVYAAYASLLDGSAESVAAAVNIGYRPTIAEESVLRIEAHLLDWSADCYDKELRLEFIERIRGEEKFSDFSALQKQIKKDCEAVRNICEKVNGYD